MKSAYFLRSFLPALFVYEALCNELGARLVTCLCSLELPTTTTAGPIPIDQTCDSDGRVASTNTVPSATGTLESPDGGQIGGGKPLITTITLTSTSTSTITLSVTKV
ncbi:hypothetical protein LX36DRAFT_663082 [Colletotrichum falcatum]|nr:hypothetical protein LX36DRAFT_663082 [Colletotrichum falcatum]